MTGLELIAFLLGGALVTIQVTILSAPVALAVAFALGLARLSRWCALRVISNIIVEIFRGTSVLVQLFVIFFVLPAVLNVRLSSVPTAVIALGLNFGAYASEVVRSAIISVDRGQREAAAALNMTPRLAMLLVVLPQALRTMLPPFGNYGVQLFKATSITSLVQIHELTFRGYIAIHTTFETVKILSLVAIIYFIMIFPASRGVRWLERHMERGSASR